MNFHPISTPFVLARFSRCFAIDDRNQDGYLDPDELEGMMKRRLSKISLSQEAVYRKATAGAREKK